MTEQLAVNLSCFELIIFCLKTVEGRQKNGQLSEQQQEEFNALKKQIEALSFINGQLLDLTQKVRKILGETQRGLEGEIDNLHRLSKKYSSSEIKYLISQQEEITNKLESFEYQLEVVNRFTNDLNEDKDLAKWLEDCQDSITINLGNAALKKHRKLKKSYQLNQIDDFYWQIRQYLERIAYCLKYGNYHFLDESESSLILPLYAYKTAFYALLSQRFPEHISPKSIDQLKDCIKYLVEKLSPS